jgi:hypothetical protein
MQDYNSQLVNSTKENGMLLNSLGNQHNLHENSGFSSSVTSIGMLLLAKLQETERMQVW